MIGNLAICKRCQLKKKCPFLQKVTDEKYDVSVDDATSTLIVSATKEPPIKIVITLTSPVMRDEPDAQETSTGNIIGTVKLNW